MANSYTQLVIHGVFAVKYRNAVIAKEWEKELFAYIGAAITQTGNKCINVGGYRDHIHILFSLKTTITIADTMRDVKANSSKWLNQSGKLPNKFAWQDGYGAFSISKRHEKAVSNYIDNQEAHHSKIHFLQEQVVLLQKNEVAFEDAYLFQPLI